MSALASQFRGFWSQWTGPGGQWTRQCLSAGHRVPAGVEQRSSCREAPEVRPDSGYDNPGNGGA